MAKSAVEIIAENLPTYAHCYKNFTEVTLPTPWEVQADAQKIIDALAAAGYRITDSQSGQG